MIRELASSLLPLTSPDAAPTPTVLALTLWGETRGDTLAAQRGVAQVIANRAEHPRWWGDSVATVCLKSGLVKKLNRRFYQFSCWNADDPNRPKFSNPVAAEGWAPWERACRVALETMLGYLERDPGLVKATHYYSAPLVAPPAAWGPSPTFVGKRGGLSFYAVEPI